jgi:Casein kinase II regulatory subunit
VHLLNLLLLIGNMHKQALLKRCTCVHVTAAAIDNLSDTKQAMRKKHAQMDFGTCPRMLCRATAVIPLGIRDEPKVRNNVLLTEVNILCRTNMYTHCCTCTALMCSARDIDAAGASIAHRCERTFLCRLASGVNAKEQCLMLSR